MEKNASLAYNEWTKKNPATQIRFSIFIQRDNIPPSPPKWKYPHVWESIVGGLLFAIFVFVVIFFGIKGTTRPFIWIVEGFKADNPEGRA